MSLEDLIKKYRLTGDKKDWFTLDESKIEKAKNGMLEISSRGQNNMRFVGSSTYKTLYNDILHGERIAHHALDNYGMEMSSELVEALQSLEKAARTVVLQMKEEYKLLSTDNENAETNQ